MVRDAESMAELGRVPIPSGVPVNLPLKLTLNRDGTLLALRGEDEVTVWDVALGRFVHRWPIPPDDRASLI